MSTSAPRSDDDLLKEMNERADGTRVAPPQAPERKIKERERRALDKIQRVDVGMWTTIKSWFGRGDPDAEFDRVLEGAVDSQVKKRVKEYKDSLTAMKDRAYKRIGVIGSQAEDKFLFLKMKAQVCRETIGHLRTYINDQRDFLTELKGLKSNLRSLDKVFAKENKKIDRLQALETKANADLAQTDAGKRSAEIADADHDLRRMLIEQDPSCAETLDVALLENSRGKTAKLNAIIAKIARKKGKKPIAKVLQELAGKVRGRDGLFGATKDTALIARHFAEQEALNREFLAEPAKVRITLLPKLQPGKRIVIGGADGADDREYAISAPVGDDGSGKKVYLRSLSDDRHAIIDVTDPTKPTIHLQGDTSAEVLEVDDRDDKQDGVFLRLWRTSAKVDTERAATRRDLEARVQAAIAAALQLNADPSSDGDLEQKDINKAIAKHPAAEQAALRDRLVRELNAQLAHHRLQPDGATKVRVRSLEDVQREERIAEAKRRLAATVAALNASDTANTDAANTMLAEAQADANPAILAALIRNLRAQLTRHQVVQNDAGEYIVRSTEEIEEEKRQKALNDAGDAIVAELNAGNGRIARQITERDFTPAFNAFPDARRAAVLATLLARLNAALTDFTIIPSTTGDIIDIRVRADVERENAIVAAGTELLTELNANPTGATSTKLQPLIDAVGQTPPPQLSAARDRAIAELNPRLDHHMLSPDGDGGITLALKSVPSPKKKPDVAEAKIQSAANNLVRYLNRNPLASDARELARLVEGVADLPDDARTARRDELITRINADLQHHMLVADGDAGITLALKPASAPKKSPDAAERKIQSAAINLVQYLNRNPFAADARELQRLVEGIAELADDQQKVRRDALIVDINVDLEHHILVADGNAGIKLTLKPGVDPEIVIQPAAVALVGYLNKNAAATDSRALVRLLEGIAKLPDDKRTARRDELITRINADLQHHMLVADGDAGMKIETKATPPTNPEAQQEADLAPAVEALRQALIADPTARVDAQLEDIDDLLAAFADPAARRQSLVDALNADAELNPHNEFSTAGDQLIISPKAAPAPTAEQLRRMALDEAAAQLQTALNVAVSATGADEVQKLNEVIASYPDDDSRREALKEAMAMLNEDGILNHHAVEAAADPAIAVVIVAKPAASPSTAGTAPTEAEHIREVETLVDEITAALVASANADIADQLSRLDDELDQLPDGADRRKKIVETFSADARLKANRFTIMSNRILRLPASSKP